MTNSYRSEDEVNREQMKQLLKYVECSQSEPVIKSIFGQLGRECFRARRLDAWLETYHGDVPAFLDRVNVQQASKYWERLEFTGDGKTLVLTGRKVEGCACGFADHASPPQSLCHYCCKEFQQAFFGQLLGQDVEVEITAAFLLGDERCNTEIHLVGQRDIGISY